MRLRKASSYGKYAVKVQELIVEEHEINCCYDFRPLFGPSNHPRSTRRTDSYTHPSPIAAHREISCSAYVVPGIRSTTLVSSVYVCS